MEWLDIFRSSYDGTVIGRLLLASLLGGLIGVEREIHGRPAGFRTHLLVTVGSCLMMVVSEFFFLKYGTMQSDSVIRLDPARVAAQIVTGIGFLGAGAIIKDGHAVRGLTTAACLWVTAGIGMAVGVGFYSAALVVTAIALFNLLFLKRVEGWLNKDHYRTLVVYCEDRDGMREQIEHFLLGWNLRIIDFALEKDLDDSSVRFEFILSQCGEGARGALPEAAATLEGVRRVRFR